MICMVQLILLRGNEAVKQVSGQLVSFTEFTHFKFLIVSLCKCRTKVK